MPPLAIPIELKPITPFVRRAEELDKDAGRPESRLVAYYCRQYAVQAGLPNANATPEAQKCLMTILEQLEGEKHTMDQFTKPEAEYLCRQFAYQVFDKADAEDRAGEAHKSTAKTFYTCASFLQMLEQFYPEESKEEPTEEMQEDKKRALYAKWKATEILKAIKEGRTPQPGGYGEQATEEEEDEEEEEEDANMPDAPPEDEFHIPPPPTGGMPTTTRTMGKNDDKEEEDVPHDEGPSTPMVTTVNDDDDEDATPPPKEEEQASLAEDNQGQEMIFQEDDDEPALPPPPAYTHIPAPVPPPAAKPTTTTTNSNSNNNNKNNKTTTTGWFGGKKKTTGKITASKAQMADATELTRFALAALEDKNATMAVERLQQALEALGH